jgi:MFS family permease
MKRVITTAMLVSAIATSVFAQAPAATLLPAGKASGSDPQFAVSILTDYFEKDEKGDRVGGAWLTGMGSLMFSAGLAGGLYSLTPPAPGGLYEDQDGQLLMRGLSIGTGGAGLILGGIGISLLSKPEDRYKQDYAYLYAETDPVVQEAIAYGVMKELADEAKRGRIVGGIVNISWPLATAGGYAIAAAATGNWDDFNDNVLGALSWTLPSIVEGIIMLVSGKTDEERMLDSYQAMSASYASGSRSRK